MIEGFAGSVLIGYISPVALFTAAVCMLVLRAGASRVFFDIVGTFQAAKMIKDADSAATVFEALYLDALTGIQEAGQELGEIFNTLADTVIPVAREFEEAQIQLEKFIQEGEDIERLREEVEDIGVAFGFAGDEAMAAAAKMAQISGVLGPGSLATGTQIGMEFGLISGMETEAAMQRMINLQQQTKFMTEGINENANAQERANAIRRNSMRILDQLNTIENRSAATMEQITFVMNQFASQAHLANEEIRSMAAMSAVMIETGEEQGKGGRALKMMYARLGSDIGGARQEMERYGVSVTDAEGNMRPLSSMLKQLEEGFFEQSGAQQQATAQIIAGNRHYTRFLKLMTNLDRLRELEVEAAFALFPAMEEIERRRDTELFQLEQAEANVQRYSAALGQALIPSLTAVTEKQANFMQTLSEFAEGFAGPLLTFLVAIGQNFRSIIGPAATLFITLKSLSIAMQTQLAVVRALNTEQMSSNVGLTQRNNLTSQQILLFEMLEKEGKDKILAEQISKTLQENLSKIEKDRITTNRERIMLLVEENAKLSKNNGLRAIHKDKIEQNNEALKRLGATELAHVSQHPDRMRQARQQAAALNQNTMLMGGAGTAMMLFGKNQKMMRAGMILNTAAMFMQIAAMIKRNHQQIQKMFVERASTASEVAATAATTANTAATNANTAAKAANAAATGGMAKTIGKSVLRMGGFGLAAYAAGEVLERLGVFASKATDEIEELESVMVSATDVLEVMNDALFDPALSQQIIDDLQVKIDAINAQRDASGNLTAVLQAELDAAIKLQEVNRQAIVTDEKRADAAHAVSVATEENIDKFFTLKQLLEDNQVLTGRAAMFAGSTIGGGGRKENFTTQERADAAAQLLGFNDINDAQAQFDDLTALFGDSLDEIQHAYNEADGSASNALESLTTYYGLFDKDADVVDALSTQVQTAADVLDNFNNSREEMFHGFRSDNLTGDLVRQVQQQGVETLITTTEVVMTNVFNGLTIPEMADIIMEEIEFRGRANGFNVTANAA
jgi:TP901 family phage tail tape measure protein